MTGAILENARVIPRMTGLIFGMKSVILGMKGAHPRDEGGYPRDDGRHPRDEGRLSAHLHPRAMAARAPRLLCSAGATSGSLVPESSNRSCRRWQSARGRGRTHPPFARALARAMTASSVRRAR